MYSLFCNVWRGCAHTGHCIVWPAPKMSRLTEYTRNLEEKFALIYEGVRRSMNASFMRQCKLYKEQEPATLHVGQQVFYFSPVVRRGSVKKLTSHWTGPWKVAKIRGILVDIIADGEWAKNRRKVELTTVRDLSLIHI